VFGAVWCCLVLFGAVWCCLVLFGTEDSFKMMLTIIVKFLLTKKSNILLKTYLLL